MARPKKAPQETRPHHVSFRLTAQERDALNEAASKAGLPANDLARYRVTKTRAALRFAPVPERARLDDEMLQQITRVGINLNQIARRLNMFGEYEPEELRAACQGVDEVLRRYLASSGL